MRNLAFLTLGLAASLVASAALADEIKVSGVHNCCPGCANSIQSALKDAGATDVVLKETEVTFNASDPAKAVNALYEAGFAVKAPLPAGVRAPRSGAGQIKGKEIKLEKVHDCCGKCANAINEAVKGFGKTNAAKGVTSVTVTSENEVEARQVVGALRKAGFNAHVIQ